QFAFQIIAEDFAHIEPKAGLLISNPEHLATQLVELHCEHAVRPAAARLVAMEMSMLKFLGGTIGVIFLIGLAVVVGILMLIF
ncbi:hypothetical protein ACOI1H_25195, partial [Loktanella sp. DJP18]|uniref:hypothetical protein n=1 Tax=Loktanella sp. DJP18 TaxID=3409788 RepID=UPI003BB77FA8